MDSDPKTVVYDTNVLVAELAFPEERAVCLELVESAVVELVVSDATLREFAAVLRYDHLPLPSERRATAVERVVRAARVVSPAVELAVAADPDDDAILEAALTAGGNCVVSDDAHLRDVSGVCGIDVVPREAFLLEYQNSEDDRNHLGG